MSGRSCDGHRALALAWTFASLTPSISFALIGVVVGEFIGGESGGGLGYLIIQSLGTLNAADMMVALVVAGRHRHRDGAGHPAGGGAAAPLAAGVPEAVSASLPRRAGPWRARDHA